MVKNPPANAGDVRDVGSIPGSRRSPGGGHGNPLHGESHEQRIHVLVITESDTTGVT